jgi:threonine dehydrogenase-like Zn-dependent dehydrogenase
MQRSGFRSRCCGGGGGAPITDIPGKQRIPDMRMDDIRETEAEVVAVGCPQCTAMLEGVVEPRPLIKDLAELVADVLIEASGNPACLDLAVRLARQEGVIVVASFYGQRVAPVAWGSDFHRRRLTLRASQVSRLPPSRSGGWSFARRFELVSELLQDAALDRLLDPVVPFAEAPATYARLARAPGDSLQTVFSY